MYSGIVAITNSLIVSNTAGTSGGIYKGDAATLSVAYTDFFGNSPNAIEYQTGGAQTVTGTNRVSNPLFIDPDDFDLHLSANSSAIDSGTSDTSVTDDFEGQGRPYGNGFDRGADEYHPQASEITLTVAVPNEVDIFEYFTMIVTAQDANGNTATGYTGTVWLESSDPLADLPSGSNNQGTITFPDIRLLTPGTQIITVTDGTLTTSVPITVDNTYVIVDGNNTWNVNDVVIAGTLEVTGTGTVLTLKGSTTITARNIIVGPGVKISADGQGYGSGIGYNGQNPGQSRGGHHGGKGGGNTLAPYGDIYQPQTMGSGGGNGPTTGQGTPQGGKGGGSIHLIATDRMRIDGILSANGTIGTTVWTYGGGGGAGGAIWLETNILTGTGIINASGGDGRNIKIFSSTGCSYSGAGGRLAIEANNTNQGVEGITLNVNASRTGCSSYGEPGTIYLGRVDPASSTIEVTPTSIPANGVAQGTITVTLRYTDGRVIAGEPVSVTLTTNSAGDPARTYVAGTPLSSGQVYLGPTDAAGQATAVITSTEAGERTLWAYAGLVRLVTAVTATFDADYVDAGASIVDIQGASAVAANGSNTATIIVTARDRFGNLVGGMDTALYTSPAVTVTAVSATTGSNGRAEYRLSHNVPTPVVITATIQGIPITDTATVTFKGAELAVRKTGPVTATAGSSIDYQITVSNGGLMTATNVLVTDTLPAVTGFISQTGTYPYTYTEADNAVVWQIDSLPADDSDTFTLRATVAATATDVTDSIINRISSSSGIGTQHAGNQVSTTIVDPVPALSLSPGTPSLALAQSQTETLTLTIKNQGLLTMTNIVVTSPAVMPWVSIEPLNPPNIEPSGQSIITLTASPGPDVLPGTYRDFVTVTEASGGEKRAILQVNVLPPTRSLQLTVTNDQGDTVGGAWVGLVMPGGLVDVTPAFSHALDVTFEGTTGPDGIITLSNLPVGTYNYTVLAGHHADLTGLLPVQAGSGAQTASVEMTAQANLTLTPASGLVTVAAGHTAGKKFTITNSGAAPVSGLSITPNIAPTWVYLATPSNLTGTLEPGETLDFTLFAAPPADAANTVYNGNVTVGADGGLEDQSGLTVHVTEQMTGTLEVAVTRLNGAPLPDAAVTLEPIRK